MLWTIVDSAPQGLNQALIKYGNGNTLPNVMLPAVNGVCTTKNMVMRLLRIDICLMPETFISCLTKRAIILGFIRTHTAH